MMNIGNRITHFRKLRKMSVNKLANKAGISQSYLREIEMGNYENPSVDVLDVLCGALTISLKEFFDEEMGDNELKDSLMEEIQFLDTNQKEKLREFLKSMRRGHNEE